MSGLILPTEHSATFKTLAIEAKSIIDGELGYANDYSLNLIHAVNSGAGGLVGGPSYASVQEASEIVCAAVRGIQRKRAKPLPSAPAAKPYVDHARIVALQSIGAGRWDFARLIELSREINVAAANRCHMSTAMLLRTILNHVPPVLGFATFAEVASNYGGRRRTSRSGATCSGWRDRSVTSRTCTYTRRSGRARTCLQRCRWISPPIWMSCSGR